MKPNEFWNCTYRELVTYVNSNVLQSEERFKQEIVLVDALGNKLIEAFGSKHPKNTSLVKDVFKNLFEEELKPHQQTIEEQIEILRSMK